LELAKLIPAKLVVGGFPTYNPATIEERGNIADKIQPRNINVSFTNNSNVAIDVVIFTFYSDQLTIDVETGIVTK